MTDPELADAAKRHGFSLDAAREASRALASGRGGAAQFNHPELGGMGQWMPGMLMIGDMFNDALKARVAALFTDLARSPHQETPRPAASLHYDRSAASPGWYPASLGQPSSTGSQNGVRYAVFPASRRLAVELAGRVTIYDSASHHINGVAQAQSSSTGSLTFTTDRGVVPIDSLPIVSTT